MNPGDIETFIGALAWHGIKEVKVAAWIFYFLAKHPTAAPGYDKAGRFVCIGATRVRPIYQDGPPRIFETPEEIALFIEATRKEAKGMA